MADLMDAMDISIYLRSRLLNDKRCGFEFEHLATSYLDSGFKVVPHTNLTPDEYGVLRERFVDKFLPEQAPLPTSANVVDQVIIAGYLLELGGHTDCQTMATLLKCTKAKAGTLIEVAVNAIFHLLIDDVNEALTSGEVVKLEAIFNRIAHTTALILLADWSPIALCVGKVGKQMLLVCDGKLHIRFAELANHTRNFTDERAFRNSDFFEKLNNPALNYTMFKCTSTTCDHGDLYVAIPYFTFVDVKMDLHDRIYGRSKHVWSAVGKLTENGQGSVHEEDKACNMALEEIRMMLERGPINQVKRFHILEKVIAKGRFSDPFITRIFLNVVKLVNAKNSGYFSREGPVVEAEDLVDRRSCVTAPVSLDPRQDFYRCVAGPIVVKELGPDLYQPKMVGPEVFRDQDSPRRKPELKPPSTLRGEQNIQERKDVIDRINSQL